MTYTVSCGTLNSSIPYHTPRGIKRWCASDVCLSVAYIGPKSRIDRPTKTKIGTEVAHVTCDLDTTFKVKGQLARERGHIVAASRTACFISCIVVTGLPTCKIRKAACKRAPKPTGEIWKFHQNNGTVLWRSLSNRIPSNKIVTRGTKNETKYKHVSYITNTISSSCSTIKYKHSEQCDGSISEFNNIQ